MNYCTYPDYDVGEPGSLIKRLIKKDLKRRYDLALGVENFLKKVEKAETLTPFEDSDEIIYLANDCYFEMRIPKTRTGGVVRIYFIKHPNDSKLLVLLDGELKKGKELKIKDRVKKRKFNFLQKVARGECKDAI